MQSKLEIRVNELGVPAEGEQKTLAGYAVRFNELSEDMGGWRERIKPGALSWQGVNVRVFVDHTIGVRACLGDVDSGTLRLGMDAQGISFELRPPDTSAARDVFALVGSGVINKMSFGFHALEYNWIEEDGQLIGELVSGIVREISIVVYPAYPQTNIDLRSIHIDSREKTRDRAIVIMQLGAIAPCPL